MTNRILAAFLIPAAFALSACEGGMMGGGTNADTAAEVDNVFEPTDGFEVDEGGADL